MQRILLDSGPMIALFDQSDRYHKASVEFIRHNRHELITTLASITETLHLLDFARHAQLDFMTWLNTGGITLENIQMRDFSRTRHCLSNMLICRWTLLMPAWFFSLRNLISALLQPLTGISMCIGCRKSVLLLF
jgi:hypothetical protein